MKFDADAVTQAIRRVGVRCSQDEQFLQTTKFWTGSLRLGIAGNYLVFQFDSGDLQRVYEDGQDWSDAFGNFGFDASIKAWNHLLSESHDETPIAPDWAGEVARSGDRNTYWRYYPALRRLIELASEELANSQL